MRAPDFWHKDCAAAYTFAPIGWVYDAIGKLRRKWMTPYKAPIPVICVGNVVAGGAGKTPVAMAIGEYLKARGKIVHYLSYGYAAIQEGPLLVDPMFHRPMDVGDEGILLSRLAPTWIGHDRRGAAKLAVDDGAEILVMDDGFQNPFLTKDLSLLVIDGEYGLGNGRLIPAGPLRERLPDALERAQAVVFYGYDKQNILPQIPADKTVLTATIVPDPAQMEKLRGQKAIAFAGLGRPEKFFTMLEKEGVELIGKYGFPDHHLYHTNELLMIIERAKAQNARIVTTAKDAIKIEPHLKEQIEVVNIAVKWDEPEKFQRLLERFI